MYPEPFSLSFFWFHVFFSLKMNLYFHPLVWMHKVLPLALVHLDHMNKVKNLSLINPLRWRALWASCIDGHSVCLGEVEDVTTVLKDTEKCAQIIAP